MTPREPSSRMSNRVLIALVILMIGAVAYWAITGGLDDIPIRVGDAVGAG